MFAPNRQYDSQSGTRFYDYSNESPYDTFMKKHLQHYGYYTGRNEKRIKDLEGWESEAAPDYKEYGSDDDYLNEALKDKEIAEKELKSNQVVYNVNDGKVVTKLKEPRALFSGAQDSGLQPAKWPIEMEVLPDRVRHLDCPPDAPEPFASANEFEPAPVVVGEDSASSDCRLVFKYEPVLSPFFIKSRAGGSRALSVCQLRDGPSDDALLFESRFESGNLRRAYRVGPRDYELWLRTDLYTSKHTQWFYFRVSNTVAGQAYRFTLVNFYKSASLYNEGLRPLMYSQRAAESRGSGWRRCGAGIKYFKSGQRYTTPSGFEKCYYSLTWQTRFEFDNDTVYFAHCYPYTYSDLLDYLRALQEDARVSRFCKQRVLCRSLAGNAVHLLTIGSAEPPAQDPSTKERQQPRKPVVLVTARVHPGETNASWMMKGFLDHLTSQHPDAQLLRDNFTFKVVPMINPDGVIVGNYRCSLAGRDLNRNYRSPLRDSFPAVCAIVELVTRLQARGVQVALYCDLHGHSRRQNVFMYGCAPDKSLPATERLSERVFPAMMGRNAPDKFDPDSCKFRMQKSKEGTGRIVMYRLGVRCAYTMEATFCGSTRGSLAGCHFSCRHLEEMGAHLCDSLLDYFDPNSAKRNRIMGELEHKLKAQILLNLQRSGLAADLADPEQLDLANLPEMASVGSATDSDDAGDSSDDGGSDSSVSDGLPAHYEFMRRTGSGSGGVTKVGAGRGGFGASGRRKKRRSRKDLAAAAAVAAAGGVARRGSKAASTSTSAAVKKPIFCDHCGSARCPHKQQSPNEKSNSTAAPTGVRQKSRPSLQAAPSGRSDSAAAAATPTSSGQQTQQVGRMRSAVTVERLAEGLKPVASDPSLQAVSNGPRFESAASSTIVVSQQSEQTKEQRRQQQQQQMASPPPPRNSVELLDFELQQQQQQQKQIAMTPRHRLLEQGGRAPRMMHYDSNLASSAQPQLHVGQASSQQLSRAVSLDDANHRIVARTSKAAGATAGGGAAPLGSSFSSPASGLSMAQPSQAQGLATQAAFETINSSNTRLLASNRVRQRHRLPGHRVATPADLSSTSAAVEVAYAEPDAASSGVDRETGTSASASATPSVLPSSIIPTAASSGETALAAGSGRRPVQLGDETVPAPALAAACAASATPGQVQSARPHQPSSTMQALPGKKSDGQLVDADVNDSFGDVAETLSSEAESLSYSTSQLRTQQQQQQQQQQRRPSQWRQPPVGQEIAQTFSQPTVVLSSGSKPPVPQLNSGQSRPSTISLQIPPGQAGQSAGTGLLLVPRLPVAAEAARRLSQFRANRRNQP